MPRAWPLLLGIVVATMLALAVVAVAHDTTRAFTLGVVPGGVAAKLDAGRRVCQRPIEVPEHGAFDRVRFAIGAYGRPGPPVDLTVRSADGRPLGRARLAGGYPDVQPFHTLRTDRVGAGQAIEVCLANRGRNRIAVFGNAAIAARHTAAYKDGKELDTDILLEFQRKPRSLATLAPAIADRASLFNAGWIGPWTYLLLALAVVLGVPWLLLRALRDAAT